VGRKAELDRLAELLTRARSGAGSTVVVGGEAGIGKSRLVARFAEAAVPRARSLDGACSEAGNDGPPFAPFTEILRELVHGTETARLPALLGPGRAELVRLLPELALRADRVPSHAGDDPTAQSRLFELVLGVFGRLAQEQPLVVVVEDVQWADRSTRGLITFLSRALRDEPVLLVLTTRTDERGDDPATLAFLAELEREEHVERIDLQPFGHDEVGDDLAALLGEPPSSSVVEQMLARSDGNPFFIEELVLAGRVGDGALPSVLRDVLSARIAELSSAAREVLRGAAVAGRQVDDELLAAALEHSLIDLASALRESVEHGILVRSREDPAPEYQFRHALLREAVLADVFPGERAALHAAFAEALEARRAAGDRSVAIAAIAGHWDAAKQPRRAISATVEAAMAAEHAFSFAEALGLWQRARRMFDAVPGAEAVTGVALVSVLERAAECAVLSGEYGEAVELGRLALARVDERRDPELAGSLNDRLRWFLWEAGDRKGAAEAVVEALRLLPADVPSRGRARALSQHAGILLYAGEFEASKAEAEAAIKAARAVDGRGELALALGVVGWDQAILGDIDGGLERFREGQRLADEVGFPEGMALAATNLATLLDRVGRSAESLAAAQAAYDMTVRLGLARTYGGLLLGYIAKAQLALGRWDEAERSTSMGLRRASTDRTELWLGINRARLLALRGHDAEAGVLLRRSRAIDDRLGGTESRSALLATEGEAAAWGGRSDEAWAIAEEGLGRLKPGPFDPSLAWLAVHVVRSQADAIGRLGSRPSGAQRAVFEARVARIDQVVRSAIATGADLERNDRARALLSLYRAERSRVRGAGDVTEWDTCVAAWRAVGRPFQVAYAQWRTAAATLGTGGSREAAAHHLREAHVIAEGLGATPLQGLIETLARQARISLVPGGAGGHEDANASGYDFTPREAEVLQLVASGWTNQQIADALFITRKTASVHVSNLLAKLAVTNRGEAAALAVRIGLVKDLAPAPITSE
jgi:DNA-binding CsgD family transcriptional regulator/tetratricopeptide (TPR) repeat protein